MARWSDHGVNMVHTNYTVKSLFYCMLHDHNSPVYTMENHVLRNILARGCDWIRGYPSSQTKGWRIVTPQSTNTVCAVTPVASQVR